MHETQYRVTCAPLSIMPRSPEGVIVKVENQTKKTTHFYKQRRLFSDIVDELQLG